MENYETYVIDDWSGGIDSISAYNAMEKNVTNAMKNFVAKRGAGGYALGVKGGFCIQTSSIGEPCIHVGTCHDANLANPEVAYGDSFKFIHSDVSTGQDYLIFNGSSGWGTKVAKVGKYYYNGCYQNKKSGIFPMEVHQESTYCHLYPVALNNFVVFLGVCTANHSCSRVFHSPISTMMNATISGDIASFTWNSCTGVGRPCVSNCYCVPFIPKYAVAHKGRIFASPKNSQIVYFSSTDDVGTHRFEKWTGTDVYDDGGNYQVAKESSTITGFYSLEQGLLVFCNNKIYLWSWPDDTGPADILGGANVEVLFDVGAISQNAITSDGNTIYFLSWREGVGQQLYALGKDFKIANVSGNAVDLLSSMTGSDTKLVSYDNSILLHDMDTTTILVYDLITNAYYQLDGLSSASLNIDTIATSGNKNNILHVFGSRLGSIAGTYINKTAAWTVSAKGTNPNNKICSSTFGCTKAQLTYCYIDFGVPNVDKYLRQIRVNSGPYKTMRAVLTVTNHDGVDGCTMTYTSTSSDATQVGGYTYFDIGQRIRYMQFRLDFETDPTNSSETGINSIEFRYRLRKP
jgi:hypothetical protein